MKDSTTVKSVALPLAISTALLSGFSNIAHSHEKGDWFGRVGIATVDPDDSSSSISADGTSLAGTGVGVSSGTALGLNVVHMITDNYGIELLAATPFSHDLKAKGVGIDLGETKHLPPTLSAQYYFGNAKSEIRPYVGIGLNYTDFFEESLDSEARDALGASNLELDSSTGLSAQVGIDWKINDDWFVSATVWHIDIDTDASLDSALGKLEVDVEIDPWVYMISVGTKF